MRLRTDSLACALVVSSGLAWTTHPITALQQPIRSGVELVLIDAQVIDRHGSPIRSLQPEDFEIFIDGKRRKIAAAVFVESAAAGRSACSPR